MYWILPDGRCVCWSVAELAEKKQDELLDSNAREAYFTIGEQLGFTLSACYPMKRLTGTEIIGEHWNSVGTLVALSALRINMFTIKHIQGALHISFDISAICRRC